MAVLATLLLMSYSKILNAVIVPLTWTSLTYYTALNKTQNVVCLYDASIQYFVESRHIVLGLFAISYVSQYLSYHTFFFSSLATGFKVAPTGGFFHG